MGYLPMYLKDFGDEPSVGNLHFSTYLKRMQVLKLLFYERKPGDSKSVKHT